MKRAPHCAHTQAHQRLLGGGIAEACLLSRACRPLSAPTIREFAVWRVGRTTCACGRWHPGIALLPAALLLIGLFLLALLMQARPAARTSQNDSIAHPQHGRYSGQQAAGELAELLHRALQRRAPWHSRGVASVARREAGAPRADARARRVLARVVINVRVLPCVAVLTGGRALGPRWSGLIKGVFP